MHGKRILKLVLINVVLWLVLELIASAVLFFIPIEGDPRATSRDWVAQAQLSFDGGLYTWDDHCLWRLTPGYETPRDAPAKFWGDGPLVINAQGMRGPDRPLEKGEGIRRILILGGSHPMGMYVSYSETYGAILERRLNERSGSTWEVLNAAAPGHTSFQSFRYLEKYGVQYAPDIVISDVGVNDTLPLSAQFPQPDHEVNTPPTWAVKARPLLEISAVYRLMRRWLKPKPISTASEPSGTTDYGERVPRGKHAENLAAMRELGDRAGFSVLYLGQVSVDRMGSGRAMCVYADREHTPNIDLCSLWQAKGAAAGQFFADPIHANAAGHQLIANAVLDRIEALGWLK